MRNLFLIVALLMSSQASFSQDREWYNLESYQCVVTNGPLETMEVIYEGGDQVKMMLYGEWPFAHVGAFYDPVAQHTVIGFGDTTKIPGEASYGFRIEAPLVIGSQKVSAIYYQYEGHTGDFADGGRAICTLVVSE